MHLNKVQQKRLLVNQELAGRNTALSDPRRPVIEVCLILELNAGRTIRLVSRGVRLI